MTDKKSSNHVAQAHDRFFKMAMMEKEVAREFFEKHLPGDLLSVVDLNKLEVQPGSYIDEHRQESIADMLFKTTIEKHEAYLYLVVDHQSKPDELMPFRVLKYICNIIAKHLKETGNKKIPLVLPLVVYHGRQLWQYSTNIELG
jgi:predicted transposase/invertase (TIGR01784 family)